MKILFENKDVERDFSSKHRKKWRYPDQVKKKLLLAEQLISSADSFYDLMNYPPFRLHQLKGKRKGEWSISLGKTGYRVTLIPCDEDGNEIREGDILHVCKWIKIVMVTEVSNHYE